MLVFFLACFFPTALTAADARQYKNVLILHSYHADLPWTGSIMAGMREGFAASRDIRLHIEYMDTQRYPGTDYVSHLLAGLFHYKLGKQKFDLVLLSDNPALEFVLQHRDDLFLDTPIIFCGINNFDPGIIGGIPDITGVAEYPSYRETIEAALRLHPETREIVVIGGVANATSRENRKMLTAALAGLPSSVRFTFWDDVPVEELAARLPDLPGNSLVLVNGSVTSRSGEVLSFVEGIRAIRAASARPIYSFWDFFLGEGIVGGKLVSGREQGRAAAGSALRVLGGEDPDAIPVVAETNRFMFDHNELKRFPRMMERLPAGSVVINQPPPFYSLSRVQLLVVIGILTALILVLSAAVLLLRRAQSAVRREKERVDLLLNSTAEAIYGVDRQGRCTFCNPASLRQLRYHDERELLGKEIHALIHHSRGDGTPYPAAECPILGVLSQDEPVHGEDEFFWRADGSSFPAEYWSHPIRKNGETIGALVTFLDISERKRAEDERERAFGELNAFVYTVSHDLRAPLSAVIGFSEFLQDYQAAQVDENARVALAEIQKQGERMAEMMEDLLALAKVGKLTRPQEPLDSGEVVEEVLADLGGEIGAAGVTVRAAALPAVRLPRTLVAQIFSNLIGNAVRYAAAGGPIEIGGGRKGEKVRFFVRDHGPGIPPNERDRIFEVFFRGSTGETRSGTGIGLATVRKIAQFYGGRAWVEETPGGGATFRVELDDPLR